MLGLLNPLGAIGESIDRVLVAWDHTPKSQKLRPRPRPAGYDAALVEIQRELSRLFGGSHCQIPGFESDDMVATAALSATAGEIIVVSSDKDLLQLQGGLGGRIRCFSLHEKSFISASEICRRWKIKHPGQLAVALALIGDAGDGITGVRGCGPQTARRLFEAVTVEMRLGETIEAISTQLTSVGQSEFYTALDLTVLDPEVPEVPVPSPLRFMGEPGLCDPDVRRFYRQVRLSYLEREDRDRRPRGSRVEAGD